MDVFIILQLSAKDFRMKTKGEKQQHLQETQADQIF